MDRDGREPANLMSECFADPATVELRCATGGHDGKEFQFYPTNEESPVDFDSKAGENGADDTEAPMKSIPIAAVDPSKELATNNNGNSGESSVHCNGTAISSSELPRDDNITCGDQSGLTNGYEEDDFGEFADFATFEGGEETKSLTEAKVEQPCPSPSELIAEGDDSGWADFASAEVSEDVSDSSQPSGSGFSAAHQGDDNDEFGEFPTELESAEQSTKEFLPPFFNSLIEEIFALNESPVENSDLNSLKILLGGDNDRDEDRLLKRRLWLNLRCIEESLALKCVWNDSKAQVIHMDVLSVNPAMTQLKNSNLPAYASQLGSVLTPLKAAEELGEESTSGKTPDVSTPEGQSSSGLASVPFGSSFANDSLSVPPVEFDWQGSGLRNPLRDGNAVQGALLDLDFLASDFSNAGGDSTLMKDLEKLGLDGAELNNVRKNSFPSANSFSNTDSQSAVLARINSIKKPGKAASQEVVSILGKLPDLSFMLNPVLMFPVKYTGSDELSEDQKSVHSGGASA